MAAQPDSPPVDAEGSGGAAGAAMIYTSGTTGKPKGALRTAHRPARSCSRCSPSSTCCTTNAVHLTTGPLYHSGPLAFASLAHTLGAPIVVLRKFDPASWLAS